LGKWLCWAGADCYPEGACADFVGEFETLRDAAVCVCETTCFVGCDWIDVLGPDGWHRGSIKDRHIKWHTGNDALNPAPERRRGVRLECVSDGHAYRARIVRQDFPCKLGDEPAVLCQSIEFTDESLFYEWMVKNCPLYNLPVPSGWTRLGSDG